MLKQKRQLFEFLFIGSDLLVVTCAWLVAYWARFKLDVVPVEKGIPPLQNYLSLLLFIWLIWAFVFRRVGLYRPMRAVKRTREILLLINANLFATVLFIAVTYLFREKDVPFSRLVFLYFGVLAALFTCIERSLLRVLLREIRRRGYNLRFMLIVGAGKVASDIVARVRMHRELGIQVIGCLSRDGAEAKGPKGIPVIGAYGDLKKLLKRAEIDQIVVALPLEDNGHLPEIMELLRDCLAEVKIVPDIYQFVNLRGTIEEFEGLPVIGVQTSPMDGFNLVAKRVFDLVAALLLLILFAPLMLCIALLLKITSRGPIFYRQRRVSLDGTEFAILKFRTMYVDAEQGGPQMTKAGDDRVTALGRFLRKLSLDELPQLFNVLRGEMSIVGPRPERPVFIQEFRRRIPRYMLRHKVPAGMTGWAQVHGWRGDTSIDKRIEFDLYYIENWSLILDFKIMVLTLFKGFRNRNAY